MAGTIQLAITKYLKTTYRPDREYIDGEIRERHVGKWEHARLQALLVMWFGRHEEEWGVQVATGWRTRVSPTRVRVPDFVAVPREPQPDVLTSPPLLVVEILSPDDSYADLQDRCQDYRGRAYRRFGSLTQRRPQPECVAVTIGPRPASSPRRAHQCTSTLTNSLPD